MTDNLQDLINHIIDTTFHQYDRNKTNYLEKEEVKALLEEAFISENIKLVDNPDKQLNESVDEFMKSFDKDKDGRLSKEELKEGLLPIVKSIVEQKND